MEHQMKLNPVPFENIKIGSKDIEMRLNDEKRKLVKVGDYIRFTNIETGEILTALVIARYEYPTFEGCTSRLIKLGWVICPMKRQSPKIWRSIIPKKKFQSMALWV